MRGGNKRNHMIRCDLVDGCCSSTHAGQVWEIGISMSKGARAEGSGRAEGTDQSVDLQMADAHNGCRSANACM